MSKKHRATRAAPERARPSGETSGLITFIQQLLQEKRLAEALRAAQALVEKEPLNPISHMVLGGMLLRLQSPHDAMRQFELAIRLGLDGDVAAVHDLAVAASMARYPVHALQAARAGMALHPSAEQRQLFETILAGAADYLALTLGDADLAPDAGEAAVLLTEQSSRALQANDEERARLRAEEATRAAPGWPGAWNHLASLLFGLDDAPAAIAACARGLEAVGKEDPQLLADLVRFHRNIGEDEPATAALDRLVALDSLGPLGIEEVAKGLAAFDRDEEIHDRLAPLADGDDGLHPAGRFLLGTAAANLGRSEEARSAWRNLPRDGMAHVRAYTDMVLRREQPPTPDGRFPYFAAIEMVPAAAIGRVVDLAQRDLSADLAPEAQRYPRLARALCEPLFLSGIDARLAVDALLRLGDAAAPDAIRRFARGRGLGDFDRLFAHLALRGAGLDDPAVPATIWLGGRRRELVLPALRLKNPEPPPAGDEAKDLMQQAVEAQAQDNAVRAADLYRQVLELEPDLPEAEHNLGTALLLAGRMQEGESHVRRALELKPDYVLARCNLASLELTRGNVGAAHEQLDPLEGRVEYSIEEMVAYLRTRADLALADGAPERAETFLHALLAYDHDNDLAKERLAALAGQARPAGR